MNAQHPDNIITHALNAEARVYKMSGWAWLAFSLIAQGSMVALLRRAHPVETSQVVIFVIFSLLFACLAVLFAGLSICGERERCVARRICFAAR